MNKNRTQNNLWILCNEYRTFIPNFAAPLWGGDPLISPPLSPSKWAAPSYTPIRAEWSHWILQPWHNSTKILDVSKNICQHSFLVQMTSFFSFMKLWELLCSEEYKSFLRFNVYTDAWYEPLKIDVNCVTKARCKSFQTFLGSKFWKSAGSSCWSTA